MFKFIFFNYKKKYHKILDYNEIEIINKKIYKIGDTKPFTGKVILKYKNGQSRYEEFYKNGKPYGTRKEFYEDGKIKFEELYINGKYIKIIR